MVVKLLKLSTHCLQDQFPGIVSSSSFGLVCLALDHSLLVFEENCSELKLQLSFEHKIDTVRPLEPSLIENIVLHNVEWFSPK